MRPTLIAPWFLAGTMLAVVCFLTGCSVASEGKITIQGNRRFVRQTQDALILLKDKAPDAYQKAQDYIGLIRQSPRSGMWADLDTPMFAVGDSTAFHSVTWYAGCIAHDATHSELYHQYLTAHGQPVPREAWALVEAEKACLLYQLDVTKRIDAPQSETDFLSTCDGTHGDVNRDGKVDWRDGLLTKW